jgi:hypothetical protein
VRGVDTQTVHGAREAGREEGGGKSVAADHVGGGAHAGDGREAVDSRVELSWADVGLGEEAERKRAAEMARLAALQELLAANNVEAAQEKLDEIIRAAEADGHIDEDEQKQIDDARAELEAIKHRRAEAEKAIHEAHQKSEVHTFSKGVHTRRIE